MALRMMKMLARTPVMGTVLPRASGAFKPLAPLARFFSDDNLHTGTVKWFDQIKGFGFLVPDDGSADVFCHQTSIYKDGFRSLAEGEPVEFKVTTNDQGRLAAKDVTGPNGSYVQGAPPRSAPEY
mmetsp:Transcript_27994/g.57474  ORF Transcript_27994/g.57474 Transcript_27994/m.57474 type:complete len:125 (+) Transcript_27994:47-421(+)